MSVETALRIAHNFRRYRIAKNGKSVWDQSGIYTPQWVIPRCTRKQQARLNVVMGSKKKLGAVRWIDVSKIRSTQNCLRHKNLIYHIKNHAKWQKTFGRSRDIDIKGVNLPILVWVDGVPIIWNGNHRITANLLLGRKEIRVRMFKLRRPRWSSAAP